MRTAAAPSNCCAFAISSVRCIVCQRTRQAGYAVRGEVPDECSARISARSRDWCSARRESKKLIENGQRSATGATRCEARASPEGEVLLGIKELLQETIFENVNFVDVVRTPCIGGFVAAISYLESRVLEDLALDTETILVHVRAAKVWIGGPETVVRIKQEILPVRNWNFKRWDLQGYTRGG